MKKSKMRMNPSFTTHLVKVSTVPHDLVGDGAGLDECRDILSNTVEREVDFVGHSS